ncbi:MAG: hypothetical protein IJP70_01785 [Bacteroidales bacterium]|nr:hypothetical protein [Bacteroidales bacterium]
MKKRFYTFTKWVFGLCFLSPLSCWSAIGDWTVFPMVDNFWRIEQLGDMYYMLNGTTLVSTDVERKSDLKTYSRTDGLNGTTVTDIAASSLSNKLAVVYSDGNIDFIDESGAISNIPDYANYTVAGDRTISAIGISNDTLFVSTGFGGFMVDMNREIILSTLYDNQDRDAQALAYCRKIAASHTNDPSLASIFDELPDVNGTKIKLAAQMQFRNGRLYAAQSTYNDYVNYQWGRAVISVYDTETGHWRNITASQLTPMVKNFDANGSFQKITGIAPHPTDPDCIYACSLEGGIYRIEGDSLTNYYNAHLNPDGMTSLLTGSDYLETNYTRVGAIWVDDNGYVWFTNGDNSTSTTLRCITPQGNFIKYPTPGFLGYANSQFSIIGRMIEASADSYHFKWLMRTFHINSAAVCMYYDAGSPEDLTDDECQMFTTLTDQDGNTYSPGYFHDLKEDQDGAIWLLTSVGPFVIRNQLEAFKKPGVVERVKIPRNDGTNLADYLLAEVSCRCMVVDGANRKWIGTDEAGLYLLSADGLKQLEHFTTANSPLFTNHIASLAMDSETGTLYVGTDGGICAYQTDVLLDVPNNEDVYCYPNPVRSDYTGKLNILGFKKGSTVVISDVNNHAVFRTESDGSVIHWDLNGNNGKRVRPGVYFITAIDSGGKKGGRFKFLVL